MDTRFSSNGMNNNPNNKIAKGRYEKYYKQRTKKLLYQVSEAMQN